MKALTKKILQRHTPNIVLFIGLHGKSLAMSATEYILKHQGKSVLSVPQARSVDDAIVKQGRKRWLLNALMQSLGMRSYPHYVLIETDALPSGEIAAMPVTVVFTSQTPAAELDAAASWKQGIVVYNADTVSWPQMEKKSALKAVGYSIEGGSDYQAEFIELVAEDEAKLTNTTDPRWRGMQAKIKHKGSVLPLRLSGGLGRVHVYAALAAVALTDALGVHVLDALKQLREFSPLPGRMTLIPGIKKSLIIDDSYQMDPVSALATFQEASLIPLGKEKHRIAVVGEMAAGSDSTEHHAALGKALKEWGYDLIVAIGERAQDVLRGAEQAGMDRNQLVYFAQVAEAGIFIQRELKRGELVVVKGGEHQKLERVVKELMAFPLRAKSDLIQR